MRFSVIIPVYNAGDLLAVCLDAVMAQGYDDFELILVDDGSTDGSADVCGALASRDGRVRVIHKDNGGQPSARHAGIMAAHGDYVCYVDADDLVRPRWLETIAGAIERGGGPDLVVFGAEELTSEGVRPIRCDLAPGLYDRQRLEREVLPHAICDRRRAYTTQVVFPVAWNKCYRRELLVEHHCRDLRIRRGEDTAFVYECLLFARSVYVCDDVLYTYRRDATGSISEEFGFRNTMNDVWLLDYLEGRLSGLGFGIERQINDFAVSKVIRNVLWKARSDQGLVEASRALASELRETGILGRVRLAGLPPVVAAFVIALRMHLYMPTLALARVRVSHEGRQP